MVIPANVVHLAKETATDVHRGRVEVQDQREHRQLRRHWQSRRRTGEAPHGGRSRFRHRDGPVHRRQHATAFGRRSSKSRRFPIGTVPAYQIIQNVKDPRDITPRMLLDMVEHQAKQGVDYMTIHAGVLLEYVALTMRARHWHCEPRRFADGRLDGGAPPAEPVVHALRRTVRDHAEVRRDLLTRVTVCVRAVSRTRTTKRSSPNSRRWVT